MPTLVPIAAAWVLGLLAGRLWFSPAGVPVASLLLLVLLPGGTILLWPADRSLRLCGWCALAFLLASVRYQLALPDPRDPQVVSHYNDLGWLSLEGVVRGYPEIRGSWIDIRLDVEHLANRGETRAVRGTVLLQCSRYPEYGYGDRLVAYGWLQAPPAGTDSSYREHLAQEGIYSYLRTKAVTRKSTGEGQWYWSALYSAKDRARLAAGRLVPEPEASLLQGMVLGARGGIPADLSDALRVTGTSHIVVVSGSNLVILFAVLDRSLRGLLGKRRAYWATLGALALYVCLVGADMPVLRAAVMACLCVTARYLGRSSTGWVSLCAAALALTLLNPLALWDIGFQLSFAAALGIIVISPAVRGALQHVLNARATGALARSLLLYLADLLVLTLSAQMLTVPIVAYRFGRLSLVSPLANVLIAPVQPTIMAWGAAATLLAAIPGLLGLAQLVFWVPWLCLAYTKTVVVWLASWPNATVEVGRAGAVWIMLACIALPTAWWALARSAHPAQSIRRWLDRPWLTRLGLGGAGVAAVLVWLACVQLPDGRLHVVFFDVGQGDAALIVTPRGQQILVDGGPEPPELAASLSAQMPFWDRSLDLCIASHPDADHVTGLAYVLTNYRVEAWLDGGQESTEDSFEECRALQMQKGIARHTGVGGDVFDLGDGVVLQLLHPSFRHVTSSAGDDNNNSVVFRLVFGEVSFLFTGDIEAEAEALLLSGEEALQATVLKVAHHGSRGSSTAAFLEEVSPSYAVISVASDSRSGHPHRETIERLHAAGAPRVLRTDQHGRIEFVTDGQQLVLRTER